MVLGYSRHIFARFVMRQDLQTLLRCHMLAFSAIGGVPIEILYDRMKTAVAGEDSEGHIIYNRSLIALGQHYGRNSLIEGRTADEYYDRLAWLYTPPACVKEWSAGQDRGEPLPQ
jgi:transposase